LKDKIVLLNDKISGEPSKKEEPWSGPTKLFNFRPAQYGSTSVNKFINEIILKYNEIN